MQPSRSIGLPPKRSSNNFALFSNALYKLLIPSLVASLYLNDNTSRSEHESHNSCNIEDTPSSSKPMSSSFNVRKACMEEIAFPNATPPSA